MTSLHELGEGIDWPDTDPVTAVRDRLTRSFDPAAAAVAAQLGRLSDLTEWVAGVRGSTSSDGFRRVRLVVLGEPVSDRVAALAETLGVGVRAEPDVGSDIAAAIDRGGAIADDEAESGTDLLLVAVSGETVPTALAASTLTNTEPVKVLARGLAATDPVAWMERANRVRDLRLDAMPVRDDPEAVLGVAGSAPLAAATALLIRSAFRRTPVLLDGTAATVAALAAYETHPRAVRWWRVADVGADPAQQLALTRLGQQAVLGLGTGLGDGTAALLIVPIIAAAVQLAAAPSTGQTVPMDDA